MIGLTFRRLRAPILHFNMPTLRGTLHFVAALDWLSANFVKDT